MKIIINKNLLLQNLQTASKALAARSNIPALMGIYLKAQEGKIIIITSNGDLSIKEEISNADFKIESDGECLIPGKLFCDMVRKLNGDDISLELLQDNMLRIICGATDGTMNLMEVADYPTPSFNLNGKPITIQAAQLKEIIRQTTFATAISESKPILTGVSFKIYGNKLLAVSTDSFRLSRRSATLNDDYLETNIIVPAKSLNELSKIVEDKVEAVDIYLDRGRILYSFSNIIFESTLLSGNYPDTTRLIPTNFPTIVKFNKLELLEAIDRVSTMSTNPNAAPVVKLQIAPNGSVTLSSNTPELGNITDTIVPTETVSMSEIKISFSATYFLDALRAFNSEEVYVKFTGEIKPFIFEAEDDPGLVELVLPMKSE